MSLKIALAGNPNAGKTTLFNALTGSNQFVGNWPGVTVEKKEGKLKGNKEIAIVDLPGIYSLSPYTLEEVIARDYLLEEKPDVLLNIIDGTNLERNLYLTTQLAELGIPMIVAINMMDVVDKNGDKIDTERLSKELGCAVMPISALKGTGIKEVSQKAIELGEKGDKKEPQHKFGGAVEHTLAHIEELALHDMPEEIQKWYAIKLFERDEKVREKLNLAPEVLEHIEKDIAACEEELDDDAESIITGERYNYIGSIIDHCYKKKNKGGLSTSDKIDRVITNRWLGLPIFAAVMIVVYYISVTTVGAWATDWTNDGLFGDGFYLGGGKAQYEEAVGEYDTAQTEIDAFVAAAEKQGVDPDSATTLTAEATFYDDEGEVDTKETVTYQTYQDALKVSEPEYSDYGTWVPGIPTIIGNGLDKIGAGDTWVSALVLDGIVAGVGAVLGFVPQMLVLFIFLAFLEGCGYMARVAFIMDRIFRKFGLSGKSFIPMLIGTGCGVPGIMASRTIENERDRRMTVMTTTFIPCGAKLPIIALIAGALFDKAWWVAPSAYFVGVAAIVISGIILKKTKMFAGEVAPFVMELPAYHLPTVGSVLRSMWERGWSFIKKAGTIILLSTIVLWFLMNYGFTDGGFGSTDVQDSLLASIGNGIAWIFIPLGWGTWRAAVAAVTGLIAKENVVGTFGVLYASMEVAENGWQIWSNMASEFTQVAAYSFLVFNLLCAPCFAAMGAIKREMNNRKWFWFAIGYQCIFAYMIALCVYQFGNLFATGTFSPFVIVAVAIVALLVYLLVRPDKNSLDAQGKRVKGGAKA